MKLILNILLLFIILGYEMNQEENTEGDGFTFYVGTYTGSVSKGIYKYSIDNDGILKKIGLAAKANNPSFLAKSEDQKYILAVSEISRENAGEIVSFKIAGDSLEYLNKSSSGGAHPCFVSTNKYGYVLAANYTGGNVGLLKLNSSGKLSSLLDVQKHEGKGTTDRQKEPHAHSAWFSPFDNSIISVDLGTNELWFSEIDVELKKLKFKNQQKIKMKEGAGPRHLDFHPNGIWIYVVNELDCTVTLLEKNDNGIFRIVKSISTLPIDYNKPNTCADIHISSDGNYLYASNRGHNSIVIYNVNKNDGSLSLVDHVLTKGDSPRNFALSPDNNYLLVANQKTNNIVSFKRDKTTGLLEFVSEIEAPSPVCILFL